MLTMKFMSILPLIALLLVVSEQEHTMIFASSLQGVPCTFMDIPGCVGEKLDMSTKHAKHTARKEKRLMKKATVRSNNAAISSISGTMAEKKKKIVEKQHLRADADSRCPIHVTDIYSGDVTAIGFCAIFTPCYLFELVDPSGNDLGPSYVTIQPFVHPTSPIETIQQLLDNLIPTCAALAPGENSNCPSSQPYILGGGNFAYVDQEAFCEDINEYNNPYIVDFVPLIDEAQSSFAPDYELEVGCFEGVGPLPIIDVNNGNSYGNSYEEVTYQELRLAVDITDPVCQQIVKACPGPPL